MPKLATIIKPDAESWLKKFRFGTEARVRICETDMLGHVNNVTNFIYYEQARVDYFRELELLEPIMKSNDIYFVTADIYCQYLSEIYFGELLDVKIRTSEIRNKSMDFEYAIIRKEKNEIASTAKGAVVFVDKNTGKATKIPDFIYNKIKEYEPSLEIKNAH